MRDKYIFVLCLHCGRWFSFNVSSEERGFYRCFCRGDCHQFASWHLNHPLQIWVFEMQIQLRLPRQIKRHTQEWEKTLLKTLVYWFLSSEFATSNTPVFVSLRREQQHRQIMRLTAKTAHRLIICLFVVLSS